MTAAFVGSRGMNQQEFSSGNKLVDLYNCHMTEMPGFVVSTSMTHNSTSALERKRDC